MSQNFLKEVGLANLFGVYTPLLTRLKFGLKNATYLIGQKFVGHKCRNFSFVSKILSDEIFCPSKILSDEILSDKVCTLQQMWDPKVTSYFDLFSAQSLSVLGE